MFQFFCFIFIHDLFTNFNIISQEYPTRPTVPKRSGAFKNNALETLRSTTRPVRQRVSNFSSKMSPKLFNAVKV